MSAPPQPTAPAGRGLLAQRSPAVVLMMVAVASVVLTVAALAAGVTFGDRDAADVVGAANRFPPLTGWQRDEAADRTGSGCLDTRCPQVYRRWSAPSPPTVAQLRGALAAGGWVSPSIDGDCQPLAGRSGAFPLCTAHASSDRMDLVVTVTGSSVGTTSYQIALTIEAR